MHMRNVHVYVFKFVDAYVCVFVEVTYVGILNFMCLNMSIRDYVILLICENSLFVHV